MLRQLRSWELLMLSHKLRHASSVNYYLGWICSEVVSCTSQDEPGTWASDAGAWCEYSGLSARSWSYIKLFNDLIFERKSAYHKGLCFRTKPSQLCFRKDIFKDQNSQKSNHTKIVYSWISCDVVYLRNSISARYATGTCIIYTMSRSITFLLRACRAY